MQFGFQKHLQTEKSTLLFFVEQIKRYLDEDGAVRVVFLDFKKAFTRDDHNVLLSKLSKLNLSVNALTWMESYKNNREKETMYQSG